MTEPYRDPDGPIHAVLAAADAAEPRVRLVGEGALIHARYEAPRRPSQGESFVPGPRNVPWSVRNETDTEIGVMWTGERTASIETNRPGHRIVRITDPVEVERYRAAYDWGRDEAKRRTRRDVAAVIT